MGLQIANNIRNPCRALAEGFGGPEDIGLWGPKAEKDFAHFSSRAVIVCGRYSSKSWSGTLPASLDK